jgi:hypothetical protein
MVDPPDAHSGAIVVADEPHGPVLLPEWHGHP